MPIEVRIEPIEALARVGEIPIAFEVLADPPWVKDYDAIAGNAPADWPSTHDVRGWTVLGAYDGDERVGAAVVDGDALWDLRVHPDHRRGGVGSALWRAAESVVRAGGHRAITVETQDINAAACAFYERMGCTVASIDPDAYPDQPGETQVIYRKALLAE